MRLITAITWGDDRDEFNYGLVSGWYAMDGTEIVDPEDGGEHDIVLSHHDSGSIVTITLARKSGQVVAHWHINSREFLPELLKMEYKRLV